MIRNEEANNTILIVDDMPENLDILVSALGNQGYDIIVAKNGKEAFRRMESSAPDIVLLDVLMPEMDGFQVLRMISSNSKFCHIPVIVITALTGMEDKIKGFELGAVDYVTKPFEHLEVLARIKTHLSIRNLRKQLEESNKLLEARVKERTEALVKTNRDLKEKILDNQRVFQALQESEARFQSVFEQAAIGIAIVGLDGNWIQLNPMSCAIMGYSKSELIGMPFESTTHESDIQSDLDDVKRLLKGHSNRIFKKKRFVRKDASVVWVSLFATLVRDVEHKPQYFIVVIDEITDQVRAEEALRENEEKYRQLFESDSDAVMIIDSETYRIQEVNPAAEKLFGYSKAEFKQIDLETISNHDDKFMQILKTEESGSQKIPFQQFIDSGGAGFMGEVSIGRFTAEGRRKIICGIRDITERKNLEDKLRQAYKMEAIGTLAGGIAHDFNNILYAMIGYAEISIQMTEKDSKVYRNMEQILKAGNRAKELVYQILTFSRQDEKEIKPIQIKPLIKEALKLIRASLPTTIELVQDIKSQSVIMADPTQIHQIIMNLCTNAGHAMKDKGGTLEISLVDINLTADFTNRYPDLIPGSHIRLTVSDTGCGISSDLILRIFDPFFTTKCEGEGTGMGLSMVHGIVKGLGGAVTVYSEMEIGSVFNVYLPVIEDVVALTKSKTLEIPKGNQERVLFVDDEGPLVDVGGQIIESLGYQVFTETASPKAFEKFKTNPDGFDLIVTDMTMPKMTGLDLAEKVMEIRPDMPVILCTGFSAMIDENEIEKTGIRGYITKPILKHEMALAIRKALADNNDEN